MFILPRYYVETRNNGAVLRHSPISNLLTSSSTSSLSSSTVHFTISSTMARLLTLISQENYDLASNVTDISCNHLRLSFQSGA